MLFIITQTGSAHEVLALYEFNFAAKVLFFFAVEVCSIRWKSSSAMRKSYIKIALASAAKHDTL